MMGFLSYFQIAGYLVEKGVDVKAVDVDGISALHLAAHHAHLGLCKFLLCKCYIVSA